MLAALLLAGLVAAPLGSAGLFLPDRKRGRARVATSGARRAWSAAMGTMAMAIAVAGVLRLLGVSVHNLVAGVAGLVFASLLWLPATGRWNTRAHLCWASSVFLFVAYLAFALEWTFASHLGAASTGGGILLWLLEVAAAIMSCAYLWELCEALGTQQWRRRLTPEVLSAVSDGGELPFVSLHVPAHNEPPGMVIDTLRSLLHIDYPRYEVILIDDNTDDEALWRPVERWCARHGVKFAHLENWPGYKSGALNYALRTMTDPRAQLIGVVDSDYQIEPGFLRRCVPAFADPWTGFVQAPQDYRGWSHARYYRRLYFSYQYFFTVSQPSRNEHNGAIFAGTMGLIRRVALDALGGWDEWCITEDAELSLRLLRAGWSGLHVDQSWGHGIMPLTFEALKGQRYRWCFGGIQILRMHWRSLLPGRASVKNRLSAAQRWAYLAGGIQWYGDLLNLFFLVFLLVGAADLTMGGGELFIKLSAYLAATVPVLVGLGLMRAVALLRHGTGASWRDAFGTFFIWQATSVVVARASVLGLFARKAAFLRTPKTSERARWWEALRANWAESTLAVLGAAGITGSLSHRAGGPLLAALLVFPTLGMTAAPFNSWAAQRASLPAWLRERRRTEQRRDRRVIAAGAAAAGGLVSAAGVVVAAVVLMLAPSPHPVRIPDLVTPARGGIPVSAGRSTPAAHRAGATPPSGPGGASARAGAAPTSQGRPASPTPSLGAGATVPPATSTSPAATPSATPAPRPTAKPTASPTAKPSTRPTGKPTTSPAGKPTSTP